MRNIFRIYNKTNKYRLKIGKNILVTANKN